MVATEADPVEELARADEEYERLREAVEEVGEARLRALTSTYRNFEKLLDRHEESATGYGDFEDYVAFQEELDSFVDRLDDDLLARDAFQDADDVLQQRRLSVDDFDSARTALEPAQELVERYEDWQDALARYREARSAVSRRKRTTDERISDLRRMLSLGAADLDAPVERLREPIAAYNETVRDAFRDFKREASAREVLDFVTSTRVYPLVEYRQPPARLREFVADADVGEKPVTTLLEYADYSQSKLAHYVEKPHELKRHVATNRTYLERLDAEPLVVVWPPRPASSLRWRAREIVSVVGRFAPEAVVERARAVRELTHDPEAYGRLREAAHAIEELEDDERERLQSGDVSAKLDRLRADRDRLADALREYPER